MSNKLKKECHFFRRFCKNLLTVINLGCRRRTMKNLTFERKDFTNYLKKRSNKAFAIKLNAAFVSYC